METLKASGGQKAALIAASVNRAEFIVAFGRVGVWGLPASFYASFMPSSKTFYLRVAERLGILVCAKKPTWLSW